MSSSSASSQEESSSILHSRNSEELSNRHYLSPSTIGPKDSHFFIETHLPKGSFLLKSRRMLNVSERMTELSEGQFKSFSGDLLAVVII